MDDANGDPAGRRGDDRISPLIASSVQRDAEEFQIGADSRPDGRRMLANASREDQGIQATEYGSKGADHFFT